MKWDIWKEIEQVYGYFNMLTWPLAYQPLDEADGSLAERPRGRFACISNIYLD